MLVISLSFIICHLSVSPAKAANYDNPDTIVVARDGTGQFRTIGEAIEVCRAFMDYHKVIYVKRGIYKEKLIIPQWLQNIEICGEDRDQTVITYDDHANIIYPSTGNGMGTFRTYTLRVDGNSITVKNITIENNAACRFLGNQDTVYTGMPYTRLLFRDCYIEGTTDFIFGASTAWFEHCAIYCKINSYITAASTPQDAEFGYVFNNCTVTTAEGADKVYLGRPWRDYGYTLFMNCDLPKQIRPEGWHHWEKQREQTARYLEYNNHGEGAKTDGRVGWSRQLTKKEAQQITMERVFSQKREWRPE